MIIDLTTQISKEFLEWIENFPEDKHVDTGHIGTHLNVYNKSNIPLEYFKTNGIIIDVSDIAEEREIQVSDIEGIDIPKESFVLFHTGRISKHEYGSDEYFKDHPELSHELIEHLAKLNIWFLGIDCSGIRRGNEHQPADELCEKHGCYVIENLTNLDRLLGKDSFTVYTMWKDHPTATGLPVRVIAEL